MLDLQKASGHRALRAMVFLSAMVCGVTAVNLVFATVGHVDGSALQLFCTIIFKFGLSLAFAGLAFILPAGAAVELAEDGPLPIDMGGFWPVRLACAPAPRSALVAGLRRPPRFLS